MKQVITKRNTLKNWFYTPIWKTANLECHPICNSKEGRTILILVDNSFLGSYLSSQCVKDSSHHVHVQEIATALSFNSHETNELDPLYTLQYEMEKNHDSVAHLIIFWPESFQRENPKATYHQFATWLKTLAKLMWNKNVSIKVVLRQAYSILGTEILDLPLQLLIGLSQVLNEEMENIQIGIVDVSINENELLSKDLTDQLMYDLLENIETFQVAYRGLQRWLPEYQAAPLQMNDFLPSLLKPNGVYLIFGGCGGIGTILANHLRQKWKARLVLSTYRNFPYSLQNSEGISTTQVDITDPHDVKKAVNTCLEKYHILNGIFHLAGVGGGGFIQRQSAENANEILSPKVDGVMHLKNIAPSLDLDFIALFSSLSSCLPEMGQGAYTAANRFLDQAAVHIEKDLGIRTLSINWARWKKIGMSKNFVHDQINKIDQLDWITPHEAMNAFEYAMQTSWQQVIISPYDLQNIMQFQKDCVWSC